MSKPIDFKSTTYHSGETPQVGDVLTLRPGGEEHIQVLNLPGEVLVADCLLPQRVYLLGRIEAGCFATDRFNLVRRAAPATEPATDATRPNHYRLVVGGAAIECFDVLEALRFNFNLGNVLKYLWRCGRKTPDALEDLKKARVYLDREIEARSK